MVKCTSGPLLCLIVQTSLTSFATAIAAAPPVRNFRIWTYLTGYRLGQLRAIRAGLVVQVTKLPKCLESATGTLDRPGSNPHRRAHRHRSHPPRRADGPHRRRLGALPELEDLRLHQWAHVLRFRGHFSTRSRACSVPLGALRQERHRPGAGAGARAELEPRQGEALGVNTSPRSHGRGVARSARPIR
ncbi:replication initiator [Streptomyces sp. NPDC002667]|uniref:replication initiator n=1 Tax=Streptomyces sp. NPDC002667 TaxID=3364657 RepID=UPI0036A8AEC4